MTSAANLIGRMFNFWLDVIAWFFGNFLFMVSLPLLTFRSVMNWTRRMLFGYTGDTVAPVNKIVLVTGCDSGIGRASVIRLLQRGFTVMAGCLDAKAASASSTLFAEFKGSANLHVLQMNVTKQNEVDAAAKYVSDYLDNNANARFWGIVNNASIHSFGPFEFLSTETLQQMFDINVLGYARVTKAFLPLIRRSGTRAGGRVVNVGCVGGTEIPIPMLAYNGATKAASNALSQVWESELSQRFNIRSITVNPDDTYATEMFNPDRLVTSFNREVEKLRPEVIDAYGGQERIERMRQLIGKALPRLARNDPRRVVDGIVDALTNPNPQPVYYAIEWKTRMLKTVYEMSPMLFKRLFIDMMPMVMPTSMLPASTAVALMAGQWNVPVTQMPGMNAPVATR